MLTALRRAGALFNRHIAQLLYVRAFSVIQNDCLARERGWREPGSCGQNSPISPIDRLGVVDRGLSPTHQNCARILERGTAKRSSILGTGSNSSTMRTNFRGRPDSDWGKWFVWVEKYANSIDPTKGPMKVTAQEFWD
jgi:hypothetical protein